MAEITVRAIDSALAMEEVQKRLGDDALIISTQRIDGQIEITATDEEVIKPEKAPKPFILGDIYRQDNFSAVLDRKVGEVKNDMDRNGSRDIYSEVASKISKIYSELSEIKLLLDNFDEVPFEYGTLDKLKFIGFRPSTLDIFDDLSNETEIGAAVRKLAKAFVNGKCNHFESSDIIIITGAAGSGKSTFADKFIALQKNNNKNKEYIKVVAQSKRKLMTAVKNLNLSKDKKDKSKQPALVIDTSNEVNDINLLLIDVCKANPESKISVIHTVPVGSSYESLKKEFKVTLSAKQYWAFTKLDLCDLSVGEMAAMIELENKCMFFSGMDKVDDGAYYSKVDQIEAYLLKKLKEETE